MSANAVYKNQRCRLYNETAEDMNDGPRLDLGDGLLFRVGWWDPDLIVDPTDSEWEAAEPMLPPIDPRFLHTLKDGTTMFFRANSR